MRSMWVSALSSTIQVLKKPGLSINSALVWTASSGHVSEVAAVERYQLRISKSS